MNIVLGATGTNGREVVRALLGMGERVRAVVREPSQAVGVADDRVEVVAGDLTQPESLERALAGGSRLFLLVPVSPTQADMELDALRAARAAGIGRVVKLSAIGAVVRRLQDRPRRRRLAGDSHRLGAEWAGSPVTAASIESGTLAPQRTLAETLRLVLEPAFFAELIFFDEISLGRVNT